MNLVPPPATQNIIHPPPLLNLMLKKLLYILTVRKKSSLQQTLEDKVELDRTSRFGLWILCNYVMKHKVAVLLCWPGTQKKFCQHVTALWCAVWHPACFADRWEWHSKASSCRLRFYGTDVYGGPLKRIIKICRRTNQFLCVHDFRKKDTLHNHFGDSFLGTKFFLTN